MTVETANRLVQLRKESGLSQEELAMRLGISRQAVSKWERAESSPDTDNLIALAKLYRLSLDALLFDKGDIAEYTVENMADDGLDKHGPESAFFGSDSLEYEFEKIVNEPEAKPAPKLVLPERPVVEEKPLDQPKKEPKTTEESTGSYFKDKEKKEKKEREERSLFNAASYPVIITIVYLCLGFFLNMWHPGWLLFLTIPLFYLPASMKTPKKLMFSPIMLTLVYLVLGFYFHLWHPGWMIFLLIPLPFINPKKKA